jgi:hypothetical protein
MATTEKYLIGSVASLLTAEMNSLASAAVAVAGTAFNNTAGGGGGDGCPLADVELLVTFGVAPTANTGVSIWWLRAVDGTNYEDGTAAPVRQPDVIIGVGAVTTAQRLVRPGVRLPPGSFKALILNNGTGQAFAASGNTLKILPYTFQAV